MAKVSATGAWDRDVCFEYDRESIMYRYEAASKRFFAKRYGWDHEVEIPYHNKGLFEAQCHNNRIIPEELYRSTRAFDAKFAPGGWLDVGLLTGASPQQVLDRLGIEENEAKGHDRMVFGCRDETGGQVSLVRSVFGESRHGYVRVSRLGDLPIGSPDGGIELWWDRVLEFTPAGLAMGVPEVIRADIAAEQDPAKYRHDLMLVSRLFDWDAVTVGVCAIKGRPGVEWDADGITVTTDPDMLWSVPGSILLPTLDELGVDYHHIERSLDDGSALG